MANRYAAGGRMSASTAATANHVGANLWNPHGTKSINVLEIWWAKLTATADAAMLERSTTAGTTPGTTVTPDADNAFDRRAVPASGAVLYLGAYASTQPTLQTPPMAQLTMPAAIGSGFMWVFPVAIEVPAGTGLAVATPTALALIQADVTFVWDE